MPLNDVFVAESAFELTLNAITDFRGKASELLAWPDASVRLKLPARSLSFSLPQFNLRLL